MAAVPYSNADLNRFWLLLMRDNVLMVFNALSPQEPEDVPQSKALVERFDALFTRANRSPTAGQTVQINRDAYKATQDFRTLLLHILNKMLTSKYFNALKPTAINLFVNEAERYLALLNTFAQNKQPVYDPLEEEIFWLPTFSLQNRYIADNIGYFQERTRDSAQKFASLLNKYAAYSVELKGLSRIGMEDFSLAREHHIEVVDLLNGYYEFLNNLTELLQQKKLPGSMSLVFMDRARRILCLFLKQMAAFLGSRSPDCDPFAPRISAL